MKAFIVFVLIVGSSLALWIYKPWEPARYDDTKEGQEARKTDSKVDIAIRFPNIWEANDFLKNQPTKMGFKELAFGDYGEISKLVTSLYTAGASNVSFAYIRRSVRIGDQPEGMYAVLPTDPLKRKALFTIAANWPHPPKDVNQKYIYMRIQGWDVNDAEKNFLGE